jgi:SAM-dependent methyltransferase
MCDVETFRAARTEHDKTPALTAEEVRSQVDLMLVIAERLGYVRKPGDRVLDFGCGIGESVGVLLGRGFDAYGVDVGEWWGRDHAFYWHTSPVPPKQLRDRLSTTDERAYHLPYPDGYFDLIMSSQVFEHVFNYVDTFRELGRVLKPGGVSVHLFPGPGTPFEPHVYVPITPLAKYDWWLRLWSSVRRRHKRTWDGEFAYLREQMKSNNYPSRRSLLSFATAAGVKLSFREGVYIEAAKRRPWRVLKMAQCLGLGWLAEPVVRMVCQRCMLITKTSLQLDGIGSTK